MFYDDDNDVEEERMRIVEYSRKHCKGTKEEIELYEELSLALELIQDDSFRVLGSRICNGIDFHIVTQYPNGLPVNVGSMFFNINTSYNVKIEQTPLYCNGLHRDPGEINFAVRIKKYQVGQNCYCYSNNYSYTCACLK